ncbi:MAG: hypothetical protein DRJ59_06135 [Thermoprotei archaeon]|nr:MAG: hypothetical protein DRJ59_06135 [Thermoprotei archaeon]
MVKVSVIIPAKNAEQTIAKTIESILDQDVKPLEIIVVDGGSTDRTVEIALRYSDRGVKVVKEPPHEGSIPAIGRNFGAKFTRGDILLFIDPDCLPERSLITKVLKALSNPKVGIYSVIVRDGKGTVLSKAWHFLQLQIEYDFAPSRVLAVKKEIFDRVGGFDETLPTGEDNDFSYRVMNLGYEIVVDKETVVLHDDDHAASLRGIIKLLKWYRIGKKKLVERYPERFKKYRPSTSLYKNHILPILRAFKEEGISVGLACILIKALSLIRHI